MLYASRKWGLFPDTVLVLDMIFLMVTVHGWGSTPKTTIDKIVTGEVHLARQRCCWKYFTTYVTYVDFRG